MKQWIDERFSRCTILLPDSVYRLSLQISDNFDEPSATDTAKQLAEDFITNFEQLFLLDIDQKCKYEFLRSSELVNKSSYSRFYSQISDTYNQDEAFHEALDNFVVEFITHRKGLVHDARYIAISKQFVMEELAIAACMVEDGAGVSIYPGSISIFNAISEYMYSGLPDEIKSLINVGLCFKKRKGQQEEHVAA